MYLSYLAWLYTFCQGNIQVHSQREIPGSLSVRNLRPPIASPELRPLQWRSGNGGGSRSPSRALWLFVYGRLLQMCQNYEDKFPSGVFSRSVWCGYVLLLLLLLLLRVTENQVQFRTSIFALATNSLSRISVLCPLSDFAPQAGPLH
jgi:hypothetical protein